MVDFTPQACYQELECTSVILDLYYSRIFGPNGVISTVIIKFFQRRKTLIRLYLPRDKVQ